MVCAFNEGTGKLGFGNVSGGHGHIKCHTDLLGFCSGAFEVSTLLRCGTTSLYEWCPTFWDSVVISSSGAKMSNKQHFGPWRWDHHIVSKCWAPITQWCNRTCRKNDELKSPFLVKPSTLAIAFFTVVPLVMSIYSHLFWNKEITWLCVQSRWQYCSGSLYLFS
jgi:hypothetical protein